MNVDIRNSFGRLATSPHCAFKQRPSVNASVHICGVDLQRVGVTQHTGRTPESGHYTATVATDEGSNYDCNDSRIVRRSYRCETLWHFCTTLVLAIQHRLLQVVAPTGST